jgi:hypothetical protein
MATSGSADFDIDASDIIEEAFERCGLELRTGYDARTARRSLNLMFADWANRGVNLWKVEQVVQSLSQLSTSSAIATYPVGTITATVAASGSFSLGEIITGSSSGTTASVITKPSATTMTITIPSGSFTAAETITGSSSAATTTISADPSLNDVQKTIDVLSVVIRRSSTDTEIDRMGRAEYLHIPNKTSQGRAARFFVDRQIAPTITIWPIPENSTDELIYYRFIRLEDIDASVNNANVPFRFLPCLASGLAYYLSLKRKPQLTPMLKQIYDEDFLNASLEDREKVAFTIVPTAASLRVY